MTVNSSEALSAPSVAVRRSRYDPATEKLAAVVALVGVPNVTLPGPVITDHCTASVPGIAGRPSSETEPTKVTPAGRVAN